MPKSKKNVKRKCLNLKTQNKYHVKIEYIQEVIEKVGKTLPQKPTYHSFMYDVRYGCKYLYSQFNVCKKYFYAIIQYIIKLIQNVNNKMSLKFSKFLKNSKQSLPTFKEKKKITNVKKEINDQTNALLDFKLDTVLLYFLIIFTIGLFVGYIPFIGIRSNKKPETVLNKQCVYSDWKQVSSNYCVINDYGDTYEGESVKYIFDNVTGRCQKYIRIKTCS